MLCFIINLYVTNYSFKFSRYYILHKQTIRETILATFPTHQFLGEEDVPPGKEASAAAIEAKLQQLNDADDDDNYLWIVDPIVSSICFSVCFAQRRNFCLQILSLSLSPKLIRMEHQTLFTACHSVCHP